MSNQNSILLIDPAFDPSTSVTCSLLVKIGMDSFSYAIINKEINKVIAVFDEQRIEDTVKKLSERVKTDPYLALTYKEIKVAIHTENTISIPNDFYNSESLTLNSQFFSDPKSSALYTNAHSNFGFTSVFALSRVTDELVNRCLDNSKKYQPHAALLKLAENIADTSLLLDFTAGAVYIMYLKNKQSNFQQSYAIEDSEEFNYYLLLMMQQLSIVSNETQVYLSGIIHEDDAKFNCLKQYFNRVEFLNFVDFNLDQQVLEDMPSHYYSTLLALDKCV